MLTVPIPQRRPTQQLLTDAFMSVAGALLMLAINRVLVYFPHAMRGDVLGSFWQILGASVVIGPSIAIVQWLVLRQHISDQQQRFLRCTVGGALAVWLFALAVVPAFVGTFYVVFFVDTAVTTLFGPTVGKAACLGVTQALVLGSTLPLCAVPLAHAQQFVLEQSRQAGGKQWLMLNICVWLVVGLVWGLSDVAVMHWLGGRVTDFGCGILD